MQNPLLSVLLPVYNGEKFIREAVDSILEQTFTNFELIIIDDCSTDNTVSIIKEYNDARIVLKIKEINSGYTDSLNWGIENCSGKFIARMDADDVCFPTRFDEQIKIMTKNPGIIVCGSWATIYGTNNYIKHPEKHNDIFISSLEHCPIVHPSVMINKFLLGSERYNKDFEPAEDYEFWTRLLHKGTFYNIQKSLLFYREHNHNISRTKKNIQKEKTIYLKFLFYASINPSIEKIIFNAFKQYHNKEKINTHSFKELYAMYNKLLFYKPINLNPKISLLKTRLVIIFLKENPLSKQFKIFFFLTFNDKLNFLKHQIKCLIP